MVLVKNWSNVIMYLIITALAIFVSQIDARDNKCADMYSGDCQGWNGLPWRDAKAFPTDSCPVLIEKLNEASKAEPKMIKWRKAFVLAFISNVLIWVLAIQEIPDWRMFYLTISMVFLVLYFSFNYFSYHTFNIQANITKEATGYLQSKCMKA